MNDAELTIKGIERDRVYTPAQIGDALNVSSRMITDAFKSGKISGIALGPKTIRITGGAVHEWLMNRKQNMNSDNSGDKAQNSRKDNGVCTSKNLTIREELNRVVASVLRSV